jgi:hypothetical protein
MEQPELLELMAKPVVAGPVGDRMQEHQELEQQELLTPAEPEGVEPLMPQGQMLQLMVLPVEPEAFLELGMPPEAELETLAEQMLMERRMEQVQRPEQ